MPAAKDRRLNEPCVDQFKEKGKSQNLRDSKKIAPFRTALIMMSEYI